VYLEGLKVKEYMVKCLHTVREGVGLLAATLEVLAADKTCVYVLVAEVHRAQLLEIKVKHNAAKPVDE